MNTKREKSFNEPLRGNIKITPYWLLGFLEGDGSFHVIKNKNFYLNFSISQTFTERVVLEAIREFLTNLPNGLFHTNSICIYDVPKSKEANENINDVVQLAIFKKATLSDLLIPLLDNLNFLTKKKTRL